MKKLTVKQQVLVLVMGFVLMLVAFYFLAWSPQTQKMADLVSQRTAEEQKLEAAKSSLTMLSEIRSRSAAMEMELVRVSTKMPDQPNLPALITELQDIANDAGISLLSLKPSEPAPQGEFNEIQITASAFGSYNALIDFLRRTEKASRALKVSRIDMSVRSYPDLNLNCTVSAFTMGTAQPAPPQSTQSVGASAPATSTQAQNPAQPAPATN